MRLYDLFERAWLDDDPAMVAKIIDDDPEKVAAIQAKCRALIRPDGTLRVYRAMAVSSSWIERLEPGTNLGIYWTHNPKLATPYDAGSQGRYYVFEATVVQEHVDWPETMKVIDHGGEGEIRLKHAVSVILNKIDYFVANEIVARNLKPQLYGQTFKT